MRLDKLLEENKVGSRKGVKRLLLTGQVTINQVIVRESAFNVDPGFDQVCVAGKPIRGKAHRYYMLNKPSGVVSAVSDTEHQTVLDCLSQKGIDTAGLFPVGRLDRDTEGLMFLTDNGKLSYQLAMGDKKVIKSYEVKVNGPLIEEHQKQFEEGIVFLDGTSCLPAKLTIIHSGIAESFAIVDISEGKFHQVKKMFLTIGLKVMHLNRIAIGPLVLDSTLALGTFRPLLDSELSDLQFFSINIVTERDNFNK